MNSYYFCFQLGQQLWRPQPKFGVNLANKCVLDTNLRVNLFRFHTSDMLWVLWRGLEDRIHSQGDG